MYFYHLYYIYLENGKEYIGEDSNDDDTVSKKSPNVSSDVWNDKKRKIVLNAFCVKKL